MKAVLFCANPYAFGILHPIEGALVNKGWRVLWYVPSKILGLFPFNNAPHCTSIPEVYHFKPDALFVPGNEVPHYIRGVKVQVFHGLAGEKKGHFRNRTYFDLYLTQGPYFTEGFHNLLKGDRSIEIKETGWPKLDALFKPHPEYQLEKSNLLNIHTARWIVLYAPTFSPSLTSAANAFEEICRLAQQGQFLVLIKFHDLMSSALVEKYKEAAKLHPNLKIAEERNIVKSMIMADLMISDTSSVVYEFLLLNKPVITINSTSHNVSWLDIPAAANLTELVLTEVMEDRFKTKRQFVNSRYHPYTDGQSANRMVDAVADYIARKSVPERRNLNFYRRWKIRKLFGAEPKV